MSFFANCGISRKSGDSFCSKCGASFDTGPSARQQGVYVQQPKNSGGSGYCGSVGAKSCERKKFDE